MDSQFVEYKAPPCFGKANRLFFGMQLANHRLVVPFSI